MASHVGDTWQAMCHNAWKKPMHVGHMECHVSTCMAHVKAINMEMFVQGGGSKKEKEGKKKKERERKERKRGKEKRERRRRKGERKKENMKAVFRRLKLIRPRSKVRIFDEGCAARGRFPPTPIHFTPRGRVGA